MTKALLFAVAMIVSSSSAFAAHTTLNCGFKLGLPYINSSLDVTGTDQFGPHLTLSSVDGSTSTTVPAEKIATTSSDEQYRFDLTNDSSAFEALVIYKADASGVMQAKLLMGPNAVAGELDGTCQYNSAN
jgi:hypothetical protein